MMRFRTSSRSFRTCSVSALASGQSRRSLNGSTSAPAARPTRAAAAVERERVALDDVLLDRVERADLNRSIGPDDEGSKEDAIGMPVIRGVVIGEEVELIARALEDPPAAVTDVTDRD